MQKVSNIAQHYFIYKETQFKNSGIVANPNLSFEEGQKEDKDQH